MEEEVPEDEFLASGILYSVTIPQKEAAVYLQRILKTKEYDPDNIFNQFYLSFIHFLKSGSIDISDYLISLLKSLNEINAYPILSKKILQSFEVVSQKHPNLLSLDSIKESVMNS